MSIDTDDVYPAIVPNPVNRESKTSHQTMQSLYIPVERVDCRVPLISTYLPERAQMDTDTDTVYPAIIPVNRESKTSHQTTKLPMSKLSQIYPQAN